MFLQELGFPVVAGDPKGQKKCTLFQNREEENLTCYSMQFITICQFLFLKTIKLPSCFTIYLNTYRYAKCEWINLTYISFEDTLTS